MTESMAPADRAKYAAARRAIDFVEDGMRLGLGTGSTAVHMVRALAELVREEGLRVTAAATSRQTAEFAQSLGLEVTEPGEEKWVDL
ncbi:MAG: ribose 5-phosphate isomerase A, partial [Pseudomonadota bacterium]